MQFPDTPRILGEALPHGTQAVSGGGGASAERRQMVWPRMSALFAFLAFAFLSWFLFTVNYIADDCYFYLVIARNLATTGQQTFSRVFPTNGFHPLWEYLLAAYTWIVYRLRPEWINDVRYAVPLSAGCVMLGTGSYPWCVGSRD